MNVLCGTFALGAVGAIGFFVHASHKETVGDHLPKPDRFHVLIDRARASKGAEAEALYGEALRERPKSVLIRLELARAFEARGEDAKAVEQYATFVRPSLRTGVKPLGGSDTLVRYGELCLRRGDEAEARRAFRMGTLPEGGGPGPGGIASAPPSEVSRAAAQEATTAAFRRLANRADATTAELAAGAHLVAGRGSPTFLSPEEIRAATTSHCRRAVQLAPKSALAHCLLAVVLRAQSKREESAVEMALARRLAQGPEKADVARWEEVLQIREAGGPPGR